MKKRKNYFVVRIAQSRPSKYPGHGLLVLILIHYSAFSAAKAIPLDRNPEPGYDTLLLRLIPDLLSACPHRQFHILPGLLDSRAALSNSYPNALRAMQGGSLYHFL